jgi:hypothetical protein
MYTSDAYAWRSGSSSSSSSSGSDFHTARYERDLVTGTTRQLYKWYNASHPIVNSSLSAKARCLAEGFSSELKDRSVFSQVGC